MGSQSDAVTYLCLCVIININISIIIISRLRVRSPLQGATLIVHRHTTFWAKIYENPYKFPYTAPYATVRHSTLLHWYHQKTAITYVEIKLNF